MEQYSALINVVIEKLELSYKELKFNYEGLNSILQGHEENEIHHTPELITVRDLRDFYCELMEHMERRFPGLKD